MEKIILKYRPKWAFNEIGRKMGWKIYCWDGRLVMIPSMWSQALSTESQFCKAVVEAGYLTEAQMKRASRRYRLGKSRQGGVIFWQIDQEDRIHDGKVMYYREDCHRDKRHHPNWVSSLISRRNHWKGHQGSHCLFGLHLLYDEQYELSDYEGMGFDAWYSTMKAKYAPLYALNSFELYTMSHQPRPVAIVEAEKSAVILSEHFPEYLWMATGGLGEVQAEKFRPLRGRKVIFFPDTDTDGTAYRRWYEAAQEVQRQLWWEGCPPIYVSPLLEQRATSSQKERKIDITDFLLDQLKN